MKNTLTPILEEPIAAYAIVQDTNGATQIKEMKAIDAEQQLVMGRTVDQVLNGEYIRLMKRIAKKYPDEKAMNEELDDFNKQYTIDEETKKEQDEMNALQMIDTRVNQIICAAGVCSAILSGLNSSPQRNAVINATDNSSAVGLTQSEVIDEFQSVFEHCANTTVPSSLKRLADTQRESKDAFAALRQLAVNWKLQKMGTAIDASLFDEFNTLTARLYYTKQLGCLYVSPQPSKCMGYLSMKLMTYEEFRTSPKALPEPIKFTTSFQNTHFNIHIERNEHITSTIFECFNCVAPDNILEKTQTSISVLISTQEPYVLRVVFIPILYTYTVNEVPVDDAHFDLYDNVSVEHILISQQLIKDHNVDDQAKTETSEHGIPVDVQKETLNNTFNFLKMKKRRSEINRALHEVTCKYMKEHRDHIAVVRWLPHNQKLGTTIFNIVIHKKFAVTLLRTVY